MIEELVDRIVEERNNYARIHGIPEHDVNAKIGVAVEVIGSRQRMHPPPCARCPETLGMLSIQRTVNVSVWECVQWYNNTSGLCEEPRTDTSPRC